MTAELSQMERDVLDPHVAFAELSKIMLGAEPLNRTLERIAELARAAMPDVDEVSMTLLEGGKAKNGGLHRPIGRPARRTSVRQRVRPLFGRGGERSDNRGGHQRSRGGLPRLRRSS